MLHSTSLIWIIHCITRHWHKPVNTEIYVLLVYLPSMILCRIYTYFFLWIHVFPPALKGDKRQWEECYWKPSTTFPIVKKKNLSCKCKLCGSLTCTDEEPQSASASSLVMWGFKEEQLWVISWRQMCWRKVVACYQLCGEEVILPKNSSGLP